MRRNQNITSIFLNISILVTLFFVQTWLKLPDAPPPFTATYVTGFVIIGPLVLTLVLWAITGFRGIKRIYQTKINLLWFLTLVAFAGWAILSQHWDFVSDRRAGVAQNAGLQIVLVFTFALVVFCHPPKLKWLLGVFILILVIQGIIGGLQVAKQLSLGLQAIGEFSFNPKNVGVVVVQSGDLRWLRPYGLLAHPNIYAGMILFGFFGTTSLILSENRRLHIVGGVLFLAGMWIFMLTFSRGAWGGFGVGVLVCLFFVLRKYGIKRRFIIITGLALVLGIIFLLMYRPLLASRVGASTESIEMRSVADRLVYNQIALHAIEFSPIIGIGAGNYPWYAADYLANYTDYDLRGDNVHMVALGIWSELGIVGLGLMGVNILMAIIGIMRNIWRHDSQRAERIAILGIVIAYLAIGLLDHYPWTFIHTQLVWFTMMAAGLSVVIEARD